MTLLNVSSRLTTTSTEPEITALQQRELIAPATDCVVISIERYIEAFDTPAPSGYVPLRKLVAEAEADPEAAAALARARTKLTQVFAREGESIRTLRLAKGWSQAHLAAKLGTSQPHVARIERGTENVTIQTCRKLCEALDIDMNRLDSLLRAREDSVESC